MIRATFAAAMEYSAGGYNVYLDGVIGPWVLPTVTSITPNIQYVLLHAPLDVVLARSQARNTQPSATPDVVTRMHEQFSTVVVTFRNQVIETEGKSVEVVATEFLSRSATESLHLKSPNSTLAIQMKNLRTNGLAGQSGVTNNNFK